MADQLRVGQRILYRLSRFDSPEDHRTIHENVVKRVTQETVTFGNDLLPSVWGATFLKSEVEVIEVLSNA